MTTTLQSNLTRPLSLKQGTSEVSILVPADVWVAAEQLREEFLLLSHAEEAAPVAEEGAVADDQAPEMALVARFLKFATDKSEQVNGLFLYVILSTIGRIGHVPDLERAGEEQRGYIWDGDTMSTTGRGFDHFEDSVQGAWTKTGEQPGTQQSGHDSREANPGFFFVGES